MTDQLVHDQLFRQRYRFAREGDVLRIHIWSDPAAGVLVEHFAPTLEERYEVLEGELTVHIDGGAQVLGPGERAVVPPGARHRFEESIEERAALGPALADRYRKTVVVTSPPPFVQRLLFPVLASLDRSGTEGA